MIGEAVAESKDTKKSKKKGDKGSKVDVSAAVEPECDDPFPTSVERTPETEYLFNNWWHFDDTRVSKMDVNKLSKYFGGKGKENAYILIYRRTSLNENNQALKQVSPPPGVHMDILKEEAHLQKSFENYDLMKEMLSINVRHVDHAFDFDNEAIIPGAQHVIQMHFKDTLKEVRKKVRQTVGVPDGFRFFLIQYEELDNGTLQFASMVPDVDGWEEDFFLVENLYLYHDMNYLFVPCDHPRFSDFSSKISIINTKSKIKLRAMGEENEIMVPRYASNHKLVEVLQPFATWELKAWDIYIVEFGDKKSILQLTALQRSAGIPDDLEVILEETEDVLEKSKRKLVPACDWVTTGTEKRESIFLTRDDATDTDSAKFMVDLNITLDALMALMKDYYGIEQGSARRFRDMFTKRLYNRDEMQLTLAQIRDRETDGAVGDQGENLCMEVGPIPKAGSHCCTVKVDIYDERGEKITLKDEFQFTINDTIEEIFEKACSKLNVDPKEYALYTCNWADEASKKLKDPKATAEHEGLNEDCTLKLLHFSQGVSDEIRTYEVYYSATGFPQDIKSIGKVSINENQKLTELKTEIKNMCTTEKGFETPFVEVF